MLRLATLGAISAFDTLLVPQFGQESWPRFSEEARKIHYEEAPARGIHGEATADEAKALKEEGIEFYPLPILPEDQN